MKYLLLGPLSVLYGMGVNIRNQLYNMRLLKSREFEVPIMCIGNITVGGTGKTPHTEALIAELAANFRVACLSRGYKRSTRGFLMATEASTAAEIGDEPMQIKQKFPDIIVAVDGNRVRAIEQLMQLPQPPDVIILDDGFQHRAVKADINILLVDYNRPLHEDHLLPLGRLRESRHAIERANYIIITKCPEQITPIEKRIITKQINPRPYQQLLFTTMAYGTPRQLSGEIAEARNGKTGTILCVTGIASPKPYQEYLTGMAKEVTCIEFPDHHAFQEKDIQRIVTAFRGIREEEKYIFTTEKDAMRLRGIELPEDVRERVRYVPIEPRFLTSREQRTKTLHDYVRKNKRK